MLGLTLHVLSLVILVIAGFLPSCLVVHSVTNSLVTKQLSHKVCHYECCKSEKFNKVHGMLTISAFIKFLAVKNV